MDGKGLPKSSKYKQERHFVHLVVVKSLNACLPPWKGFYHRENQKIHQKLQHLFKASLILLANTATPGQYTNPPPCPVSLRVITCRPVAFCSSPIEPTLWKHSCNIIQIGRCTSANARAIKFANYLHLQTEHGTVT